MRQASNSSLICRKLTAIVAIALVVGSGLSSVMAWSEVQSPDSSRGGRFYGVVFPKGANPGDEITASVTTDPDKFKDIPDLEVITFPVPDEVRSRAENDEAGPAIASTEGISVDLGDGPQPANKPLIKRVPWDAAFNIVNVFLTSRPQQRIGGGTVPILTSKNNPPTETSTTVHKPGPSDYKMPPITTPGSVTVIQGPSCGNAKDMTATLNGQPMEIVAAIPGKSFVNMPRVLPPAANNSGQDEWEYIGGKGMPPVKVKTGRASLGMYAGHTMTTGQMEEMTVTANISGVTDWRYAAPSASLVSSEALKRVPGLNEMSARDNGAVVIVVNNRTKDVIEMDDFVWIVHRQDVVNGVATRKVKVRARHRGSFLIEARLIECLPQSTGQALEIGRNLDEPYQLLRAPLAAVPQLATSTTAALETKPAKLPAETLSARRGTGQNRLRRAL